MLYIVATPIGNLEDITLRAISVLTNADLILAEDTRVTKVLLERYNIKKDLLSYHEHSGLKKLDKIIDMLKEGSNLALVTDAGTPGISDPGNYLISEVLKHIPDLKIVPVPGANAAVAALSISGFYSDKFVFFGFPPHKKGRQTFFRKIGDTPETIVFYESKHRIIRTLEELKSIALLEDRRIMVARELTKQFETIYRGTAEEVLAELSKGNVLGEFVIVIDKI
jgi:16S rRNA (cytidine1402-2'-O)-methyltransferase